MQRTHKSSYFQCHCGFLTFEDPNIDDSKRSVGHGMQGVRAKTIDGSRLQVDLQCHLHVMKCLRTNEVYSHLDLMVSTHEKLAGMGVNIQDEEFIQILLASLPDKGPDSYSNFLSTI